MILSLILAWLTVLLVIVTAFRYIVRVSKSVKLNRIFHKAHIPVGIMLIFTGLLHGLLAGNFADAKLSDMRLGTVLFTFNWGSICFLLCVLLGLSYLLRRMLKKNRMRIHRILTACLLVFVVIHIADVGIQLPSRLFAEETGSVKETDSANDQDMEENDTPEFFERAKAIIDDVMDEQSLEVDTVSGATYSSAGILNAVSNALESAVEEGELEKNDTELSSDFHKEHGGGKRNRKNGW